MKKKTKHWLSYLPVQLLASLPMYILALCIVNLGLITVAYLQPNFNLLVLICYLFIFLILLICSLVITSISDAVALILNQNIDFEKYLSYHLLNFKRSSGIVRKRQKEIYDFAKAQVLFYKGEFEQAYQLLNQIKVYVFPEKTKQVMKLNSEYLKLLLSIQIDDKDEAKQSYLHLKEVDNYPHSDFIDLIYGVYSNDNAVLNLERKTAQNHLQAIGENYYKALYYYDNQEFDTAKNFFSTIVAENSELFYVREAKKFLDKCSLDSTKG